MSVRQIEYVVSTRQPTCQTWWAPTSVCDGVYEEVLSVTVTASASPFRNCAIQYECPERYQYKITGRRRIERSAHPICGLHILWRARRNFRTKRPHDCDKWHARGTCTSPVTSDASRERPYSRRLDPELEVGWRLEIESCLNKTPQVSRCMGVWVCGCVSEWVCECVSVLCVRLIEKDRETECMHVRAGGWQERRGEEG